SSDLERSRRLASIAAKAFCALGDVLHETFALELSGRPDAALERYRIMGSVRDVNRLGVTAKIPAQHTMDLTARQAEIAQLVALGETNREVAKALCISEHTVEHHLSAIFTRLHVKSRAQLAHVVAQSPKRV
ncbi:MAG: helix-turn-helix transcriptional regulator, partial [Candidatus Eremiobacteraeota bacterium]|nr:helix-turn-helix transcriptional regulator [Candidatus Eremiobacteraeota bacterium]